MLSIREGTQNKEVTKVFLGPLDPLGTIFLRPHHISYGCLMRDNACGLPLSSKDLREPHPGKETRDTRELVFFLDVEAREFK